jgi:hypothetical protein
VNESSPARKSAEYTARERCDDSKVAESFSGRSGSWRRPGKFKMYTARFATEARRIKRRQRSERETAKAQTHPPKMDEREG